MLDGTQRVCLERSRSPPPAGRSRRRRARQRRTSPRRRTRSTATTTKRTTTERPDRSPGRYEIERTLGGGGMAVVYLARDSELGRSVAVKVLADNLADDADLRQRFVREGQARRRGSRIPNVVRVYDAGEEDGRPYIVMECVEGEIACGDRSAARAGSSPTGSGELGPAGVRRPRACAPSRAHPPRRQAGESAPRRRRHAEGRRLRDRPRGRGDAGHRGRHRARHCRLPLARAGVGEQVTAGVRPLLARRVPVRAPRRAARLTITRRSASCWPAARPARRRAERRSARARARRSSHASTRDPADRPASAAALAHAPLGCRFHGAVRPPPRRSRQA